MKKMTLIDGNSLMFRSYYATAYSGPIMQNKKGLYTNAIFGFANMFTKLLSENEIDHIFVAFDAGSETFRHQTLDSYKANRKKLPEELKVQIPYIKEYLDILNIPRFETLEYEADDLIATICEQSRSSFPVVDIITGDKDLLQLVDSNVRVFLTRKGIGELEEYNSTNFKEKTGITPSQVVDYKGLVGDSSDNLPGIRGVGEKTAIKLLEEYQTLEGIYDNLDKLTPKLKQLFLEYKDIAIQCKYLATLKKDAPMTLQMDDLKYYGANTIKQIAFFKEMEITSLLRRIEYEKEDTSKEEVSITFVNTNDFDFQDALEEDAYVVAEVVGKNYYRGEALGITIMSQGSTYFVLMNVVSNHLALVDFLENPRKRKKTFDSKLLYVVLKRYGITLQGVIFDALLAAYLINPSQANEDMKIVAEHYIPTNLDFYDAMYGANTKLKAPLTNDLLSYTDKKVRLLAQLEPLLQDKIEQEEYSALLDLEMKLSVVLGDIELTGLIIDQQKLEEVGIYFEEMAATYAKKVYEASGTTFNLNSPKQLGEVLFEKLKLPHGKKNKTGYSTNADVLEKLSEDYEIARDILEYRLYNKLVTTYVKGLKDVIYPDGLIHPLYKQALTLTGRLSSMEPNIQNMPIRTEAGQSIRKIFTSRFENGSILSADYSQIELRILAHMSQDEAMIKSFQKGVDFHTQTAANLNEVELTQVTPAMRRIAKAINFGIIYGMSAWGLSETIRIHPEEANRYIAKYFLTYQKTKQFLDQTVADAKRLGYSKTIYGRRRYIPELTDKNPAIRSFGERTAMNAPIQGSAADIIKIAMNRIANRMKLEKRKSLLIAQVHDELVFDCPEEEVVIMKKMIKEEMEEAANLKVPLTAEVSSGRNWFETK